MARYISPVETITDLNGAPMVGAKLVFYATGTVTLKTVYSDAALTIPITNPVTAVSSAAGAIYPDIYLDGVYKVVQQDDSGTPATADGAILWTRDPVGDIVTGNLELWLTDETYNIPEVVYASDDNYYISLTDANQGNEPSVSPANWQLIPMKDMASTDGDTFTNATLTNATLTTPIIAAIKGVLGLIVAKFVDVASAVNDITFTSAATGNQPTITQTGADDVGIMIEGVSLDNGYTTPVYVNISNIVGSTRGLGYQTSAVDRWIAFADSTAEAGANAGSDYYLQRFTDAGAFLGTALVITRSTGKALFEDLDPASLITSSTIGAVGTYAYLGDTQVTTTAAGATRAGSVLRYAGITATAPWLAAGLVITGSATATTPSGTWMAMGESIGGANYGSTLWYRIA